MVILYTRAPCWLEQGETGVVRWVWRGGCGGSSYWAPQPDGRRSLSQPWRPGHRGEISGTGRMSPGQILDLAGPRYTPEWLNYTLWKAPKLESGPWIKTVFSHNAKHNAKSHSSLIKKLILSLQLHVFHIQNAAHTTILLLKQRNNKENSSSPNLSHLICWPSCVQQNSGITGRAYDMSLKVTEAVVSSFFGLWALVKSYPVQTKSDSFSFFHLNNF